MKKISQIIFVFILLLSSACSVKQVGKINMISNRNIDASMKYQLISTYSGGSKKEIRKSKSITIEDAIDKTVRAIPGGEYLMNAKIYLVKGHFFAVEGDVWGISTSQSYRGFKVGDKVTWKNKTLAAKVGNEKKYLYGIISALKNDKTCLITENETGETVELAYDEITKIE